VKAKALPASDLVYRAQRALRRRFQGQADEKGYVSAPEENLLPGFDFKAIRADLEGGDGRELDDKFRAIHSSSALAVNSFGVFKERPGRLELLGESGARKVAFEERFPIFRGGTAPNLDVWIERASGNVAVESKCTEYLKLTQAEFSPAYERLLPPRSEASWWALYQQVSSGPPQHLDCAQLLKHYFGLSTFRRRNAGANVTLLYLFWEPLNWRDIEVCVRHREGIDNFARAVANTELGFRWLTYNELWDAWAKLPGLKGHAHLLKARYQVEI